MSKFRSQIAVVIPWGNESDDKHGRCASAEVRKFFCFVFGLFVFVVVFGEKNICLPCYVLITC